MNERIPKIHHDPEQEETRRVPDLTLEYSKIRESREKKEKEEEIFESYLIREKGEDFPVVSARESQIEKEDQKKALRGYSVGEMGEKLDAALVRQGQAKKENSQKAETEEILEGYLIGKRKETLEEILGNTEGTRGIYEIESKASITPDSNSEVIEKMGESITFEEALARIPDDFDTSVLSEETMVYLSWDTNQYLDRQLLLGLSECGVEIDNERTLTTGMPIRVSQIVNGEKRSLTLTIPQAAALLRAYADKGE